MKAVRYLGHNQMVLQEQPKPVIKEYEVLVKVRACGICGSDVHGSMGLTGRRTAPMTMGHEFSGQVDEVGNKTKNFRVGDRVIVEHLNFCGTCLNCKEGNTNMCTNKSFFGVLTVDGAMAEYISVPEKLLHKMPETCTYEIGATTEPYSVAYSSVKKAGDLKNKIILVVGTGTIGLCILQIAKLQKPKLIIVSDLSEPRLKVARELGADKAINPRNEDFVEAIRKYTEGTMVDVSFEAVGIAPTVNQALNSLKFGGTCIWVGNSAKEIQINMQDVVTRELKISGTFNYSHDQFGEVVNLLGTGQMAPQKLISKIVSLEETPDAIISLSKNPDAFIKIIIDPTK
jgi:2-desacetyl-2-hydroxyethyl bacteriochlorophyllide A dehydrogenase